MLRRWPAVILAMAVLPVTVLAGVATSAQAAPVSASVFAKAKPTPTPTTAPSPATVQVWATYYGWYDNSPPGCATAYAGCAGGTGTYASPITFASDKKEFPSGTILYYPTVQKYFVMQDDCTECDQDWTGKGPDGGPDMYHVDLWIGGDGGDEFDAINCEDALTQTTATGAAIDTAFIENPPSNEPVSSQPLFDTSTGACFGGATSATNYGAYKNVSTGTCIQDTGDSQVSGATATLAACSAAPAEDLAFDGAFFQVGSLCLGTVGGATANGTLLNWTTCTGVPAQQWEINSNGTMSGIQSGKCILTSGTTLQIGKCPSPATAKAEWTYTVGATP